MSDAERIKPPWWLKPMNKVFMTMMRLGVIREGPERVRMVELSTEEARPLLRAFPTEVPTGVGFMKNAGLVTEGRPDEFETLAGRCAVFRFDPVP
jgi:hypothetical protein